MDTLVAAAHEAVAAGLPDVALALRAEDPLAVLHGYRLLAARLDAEGLDVPLHLCYADDAPLIHAAAALGTLLCDGLGDSGGVQDGAAHWSGGRRCHMLWAVWLHQDVMMLRPR